MKADSSSQYDHKIGRSILAIFFPRLISHKHSGFSCFTDTFHACALFGFRRLQMSQGAQPIPSHCPLAPGRDSAGGWSRDEALSQHIAGESWISVCGCLRRNKTAYLTETFRASAVSMARDVSVILPLAAKLRGRLRRHFFS